ncbi:MAG: NAD(P)/FAD-dependent oxidoreductase [Pyrinomonadaceae bacterium]|nr:NAD(P)/FAD-dependent oxidoreductase [Pyrinomonadaceae bacterium]
MSEVNHDLIIAGAGPAGMSAALWANELNINHLVLESGTEPGGQLLKTFNPIDNHLGVAALNGNDLRDVFFRQVEKRTKSVLFSRTIRNVDIDSNRIQLENGEKLGFRALLVATGVRRRRLEVTGEIDLRGKGIILSGKKQAVEASDKDAIVVGGGDAAFENALILSEFAKKVTLIHRRDEFSARREFVEEVLRHPGIEVLTNAQVVSFNGDSQLKAVSISLNGENREIEGQIAVIRIGVAPNSEPVTGLVDLDHRGYIRISSNCRTTRKCIYAAGDVANPVSPTVSSAVGMGATAVKSILEYLRNN